jgi:hypothetical protein
LTVVVTVTESPTATVPCACAEQQRETEYKRGESLRRIIWLLRLGSSQILPPAPSATATACLVSPVLEEQSARERRELL